MAADPRSPASHDMRERSARPRRPSERRSRVWALLASLVVIQFAHPVSEGGRPWLVAYLLVYTVVIAFAVGTVRAEPRRFGLLAPAAVLPIVGGSWFLASPDSAAALVTMLAGVGVLQLGVLAALLQALLSPPGDANSIDLLLVAVCAFLLIGGVFGAAAAVLETVVPGSFSDSTTVVSPLPWQTLLYGSFVTLGAIGFGDVTAVSSWARSLFSLEGVVGVLFVAVVISRLVSRAGQALDSDG